MNQANNSPYAPKQYALEEVPRRTSTITKNTSTAKSGLLHLRPESKATGGHNDIVGAGSPKTNPTEPVLKGNSESNKNLELLGDPNCLFG
jgi:hypothetical protein